MNVMAEVPQNVGNFDSTDKKPPLERKQEWPTGEAHAPNNTAAAKELQNRQNGKVLASGAAVQDANRGDANKIGEPDVFLMDRHRQLAGQNIVIRQVWSDGDKRGYVIVDGSKIGYFELNEGMGRPDAEAALAGAYDGQAVVL